MVGLKQEPTSPESKNKQSSLNKDASTAKKPPLGTNDSETQTTKVKNGGNTMILKHKSEEKETAYLCRVKKKTVEHSK